MTDEETIAITVANLEQQIRDELALEHPEMPFVQFCRDTIADLRR